MSFKTKKVNKNILDEINKYNKNSKEKEELKKLTENIENSTLQFALIKLSINNNFLPLSIETYYEKIFPEIEYLRKTDGSKYYQNSINTVKSALVTNKLFEKKNNKLYGLNIPEAIKFVKKLLKMKNKNQYGVKEKIKINRSEKGNSFLGTKREITKNLSVNKYEKYQHGYQILNDLSEVYPKKNEDGTKIKMNLNKFKSSTELIEKVMDIDKICGMLIVFKYFKPFLKKILYSKDNNIDINKKQQLNQQISGLNDGLDLVKFSIKAITNSKNN